MDENALGLASVPLVFAVRLNLDHELRVALHRRDPVVRLSGCPNVDDLMLVAPNVDDLMNYFVDAMNYCLKTVYHLMDGQMMVYHLKKYLMTAMVFHLTGD